MVFGQPPQSSTGHVLARCDSSSISSVIPDPAKQDAKTATTVSEPSASGSPRADSALGPLLSREPAATWINYAADPRVSSHPKRQATKTLKRNEFGSHLEWSKTCELDDVFFHIPQESRP